MTTTCDAVFILIEFSPANFSASDAVDTRQGNSYPQQSPGNGPLPPSGPAATAVPATTTVPAATTLPGTTAAPTAVIQARNAGGVGNTDGPTFFDTEEP